METTSWQALANLGSEAAVALFNGDPEKIEGYQVDLAISDLNTKYAPAYVLESAAYCLASLLEQVAATGRYSFPKNVPTISQLHYMKATQPEEFWGKGLSVLIGAVNALRQVCPEVAARNLKPAAKVDKPTVQKMEIVAMPARLTDVTVERDAETLEITKTVHQERDA